MGHNIAVLVNYFLHLSIYHFMKSLVDKVYLAIFIDDSYIIRNTIKDLANDLDKTLGITSWHGWTSGTLIKLCMKKNIM
ncbi:MAG: hypothetical protein DRN37_07525 [Thermoplasmata archaeon]|nr:MAG: hypothetical protein DRN37_07525 [Thermoplasmata archaeon]